MRDRSYRNPDCSTNSTMPSLSYNILSESLKVVGIQCHTSLSVVTRLYPALTIVGHTFAIQSWRGRNQTDPWGSLTSQSDLRSKFQVSNRLFQNSWWMLIETQHWCCPVVWAHTCLGTHGNNTHKHAQKHKNYIRYLLISISLCA